MVTSATESHLDNNPHDTLNVKENEYLAQSQTYGAIYESIVRNRAGLGQDDLPNINILDEETKDHLTQNIHALKTTFARFHDRVSTTGMTAVDFLLQMPSFQDKAEDLRKKFDAGEMQLKELSPGVFAVYVDANDATFFNMRTAQAKAASPVDGVSFILIKEYKDKPDVNKRLLEENVPHEVHHLLWKVLLRAGLVMPKEENEEMTKAFTMYQDELIARLCSNGKSGGYSHLSLLSEEERNRITTEAPDTVQAIYDIVVELNELLDSIEEVRKRTRVAKKDLILAAVESTNFGELRRNFMRMKATIDVQPQKEVKDNEPIVGNGWSTVNT